MQLNARFMSTTTEIPVREALNMAIDQAMEEDDAVYVMGEEVRTIEDTPAAAGLSCCWHFLAFLGISLPGLAYLRRCSCLV